MTKDFLWGGATASYQCEGARNEDGKVDSMWDVYLHDKCLENGDIASDFYHRYKEDIQMMKEGGQNAFRFSLSWPRIIVDKKGTINQKGIKFYHEVIDECLSHGIEPFVTIYHWDLPQYLEEDGGWQNRETCDAFVKYAEVVMKEYNGKVKYWTTFNEPRWFIFNGYFIGNYPPECHSTQMTVKGAYHVMLAHAMAVQAFRENQIKGKIGIVHSYTPVDGVDDLPETKKAMRYADNYCNNWVLDTAVKGEIPADLLGKLKLEGIDLSFMNEEDLHIISENRVDYLGLNYYARTLVKAYTEGETTLIVNNSGKNGKGTSKTIVKNWFEQVQDPNSEYTEWDTEIYPKGLYDGLIRAHQRYRLPIFITENGIGYYEDVNVECVQDNWRISYMNDHINAILNAMDEGVDVRGYFVWSSFDLYSWKNGCEKRYGLVAVDFEHELIRKPKKSYYWFKDIIESDGEKVVRKNYEKNNLSM
ncbi:glycoside hydrolase family 1 protein [Clostridium sp. WB02_MRS01]|uniref:glycoside hydrolase family 1 protein n=1 Tax=Clostridium sp. WB02_MRS01 TaxID=2605777 RepID=UPI0012B2A700|nr:glycoside hydrolase family 1 protein [Clostridium sp. WB02_MRS01]MSS11336.1 glycoside hydrolase family 1 protein [Clostridium sp. WB02_MRS01]